MQGSNSVLAGYLVVNGQGVFRSRNDKRCSLVGLHAGSEDISHSIGLLMMTEDGSDILVDGDRVSGFVIKNNHGFEASNILAKWDEPFAAVVNDCLMLVDFGLYLPVVFIDTFFLGFTQLDTVQAVGFLDEAVAGLVIWPEIARGDYFCAAYNLLVRVHWVSCSAAQCRF